MERMYDMENLEIEELEAAIECLNTLLAKCREAKRPEPKPEIIEGLSPGEWTYRFRDGTLLYDVINGSGIRVGRIFEEVDAKFMAGSKRLLEAIYVFAVESKLNTKTWGRPSWNAVAYAMVNCGIEFPADDET